MKCSLAAFLAVHCLAVAANGATLSVSADQAAYGFGDTITLTVTGDAEGASTVAVLARLLFGGFGAVSFISATQVGQTSFGSALTWYNGTLSGDESGALVLNQIAGLSPLQADGPFSATVKLTATGPGVVDVSFEGKTGSSSQLEFYDLTPATGWPQPAAYT